MTNSRSQNQGADDDRPTAMVGRSHGSAGVGGEAYVPGDEERIAAVRRMLLEFKLHTTEPAWSSQLLSRAVEAVLAVPRGTTGDLFSAVFSIFADYPAALSPARANFIKDLVVECFTRHRSDYNAVDWEQFANRFGANASASQLYLGFLAIPPERLTEKLAGAIASGLEDTPYRDEVLASRGDITA